MNFRQIHLDFHTSEAIDKIGVAFNKQQFQNMLKKGHVNSVTVFSKCHHGWAYHPSTANEIHPGLDFDLLKEMIDAAHEIGVKTPVYISAGLDEKMARRHPEWLNRKANEQTVWAQDLMTPGYHQFCMNSPYLDYLLKQIEEVVQNYDADGIFMDIVGVRKSVCYCQNCVAELRANGEDPRDSEAVRALAEKTFAHYTRRVKEVIHSLKPKMPIFHNGGHINKGRRDLAHMNTHLELESLPTGGWGYDHFPLSARYAQTLGMNFLGMTGKFHTSWGEFGGYKHPNALRYEVALSIANGARCSIGDQLHPEGLMDELTYSLIGKAYAEVEQKESWCTDTTNVADAALLSLESTVSLDDVRTGPSDAGAVRMLLEGKILFDVIDPEADFNNYQVVILPDNVRMSASLKAKIEAFVANGGQILATGQSGMNEEGTAFEIDMGVEWLGSNPYKPDYFKPLFSMEHLGTASFIFYGQGQKVALQGGEELGQREDPYFNRELFTFSSHQHTPNSGKYGGPGMVKSDSGIYIAWHVFEDYATKGSLILREAVLYALKQLIRKPTLETNLPAQGVVTLQQQEIKERVGIEDRRGIEQRAGIEDRRGIEQRAGIEDRRGIEQRKSRYVNHLLYASPVKRGDGVEIIEDIIPLHDVKVSVKLPKPAKRVYLAPQETVLDFQQDGDEIKYTVAKMECHQMVVIEM